MHASQIRMPLLLGASLLAGTLLLAQAPPMKNSRNQMAPHSAAESAAIERGKAIHKEFCGICHYAASSAKKIGPGLKGLSAHGKFANGKLVDDASLRAWIERGGKDMPGFKDTLKAEQVSDLIAYLKTL